MGNNTAIQLRNDSAANWASGNPVLSQGEMGLETDTNRMKFGNGTTAWNSLPYVGEAFKYGLYTLSANQTSNLTANNHVEFNTTAGSLGGLATGSGQANGIITLPAGKTYKITGQFKLRFSASGEGRVSIYDRNNSVFVGIQSQSFPQSGTSLYAECPELLAIITATTDTDIDTRLLVSTNIDLISYQSTYLLIEEYGGY